MNPRILLFPMAALMVTGCEQLTGTKPPAVPCHGYPPDTLYPGTDSTRVIPRAHICGEPRRPNIAPNEAVELLDKVA